ncbi:argininosuccinate lyase [Spirillospora sp. CA-294931]|uniref:argininosuccinate lyase n=1 Tax=Spirillospora sp. CA-294931 TaxID=3240042 RepID=UPI003D8C4F35
MTTHAPVAAPMADTGRLSGGLNAQAARLLFGETADADLDSELPFITVVDQAHLVMLAERDLIRRDQAARLLAEIGALRANGFAPLRGRQAPRGVYTLYESHLIDELGRDVGGVLHTGRSRNDLKATVHQLRLREPVTRLLSALLRLQGVLLGRARAHDATVMPAYSQYQPAVPSTYGHYLLGVATSLERDISGVLQACSGLRECPLGAAGGGGTDVPVDPARTARLLGFTEPVRHAGFAIASRDTMTRLLSAGALAGLTLSRLATDLQLWSTQEFGLVGFPDHLVGASSAMPQKRNPFLLEHIKGGSGALIGALTTVLANTKNTPFGNSVEVSTEGVAPVWAALDRLEDITRLATWVVAGARPCEEAMTRSADRGFTVATAFANRLVAQGVPFRAAHYAVGRLITELTAEGAATLTEVPEDRLGASLRRILRDQGVRTEPTVRTADLDPGTVAALTEFGGGPGPESFRTAHRRLTESWRGHVRTGRAWRESLRAADRERHRAVHDLISGADGRR